MCNTLIVKFGEYIISHVNQQYQSSASKWIQ